MQTQSRIVSRQLIGPVLGRYLDCETIARGDAYFARASIRNGEPAGAFDEGDAPQVAVGPFADARTALQMLVSQARWEIDNGMHGTQRPACAGEPRRAR